MCICSIEAEKSIHILSKHLLEFQLRKQFVVNGKTRKVVQRYAACHYFEPISYLNNTKCAKKEKKSNADRLSIFLIKKYNDLSRIKHPIGYVFSCHITSSNMHGKK